MVILSEIPSYGDHMTLETFIELVETGSFVPTDGMGYMATADKESDTPAPFNVKRLREAQAGGFFTHVVWFNK